MLDEIFPVMKVDEKNYKGFFAKNYVFSLQINDG
jgi:hypothetical protein